ncbi:hypothetical protein PROFUN_10050 [Planoprotostelium fungivorum]|uniref:DUF4874 domain-containing protein n=1 Tax=Planoprotostelium fungivorum TaxID=1890364 RepID=A0A2P6NFE2_9EUKA|nr:hypothetical protein PROFUN_10050 [Planoprotostelium fungivorum]
MTVVHSGPLLGGFYTFCGKNTAVILRTPYSRRSFHSLRTNTMKSCILLLLPLLACGTVLLNSKFTYSTANTQRNPQKGFVAFGGDATDPCSAFPCSMENRYVQFAPLMPDWNKFDFSSIDAPLANAAARGHQLIVRIFVDYPGWISKSIQQILPPFLNQTKAMDNGDGSGNIYPDYNDKNLILALQQLIAALGAKYDGDNHIAVWQLGLLGHWGEWHCSEMPFASTANQKLILDSYTRAFKKTRLQVRYPNVLGGYSPSHVNIGFHDDSFGTDTYGDPTWSFYGQLQSTKASDSWRHQVIGGEIRPEVQSCIFGGRCPSMQPLRWATCVNYTGIAWVWNNFAFSTGYSGQTQRDALSAASRLGYQLHLSSLQVSQTCTGNQCQATVAATVVNQGNTPFYYPISIQVTVSGQTATVILDTTVGLSVVYNLVLSGPSVSGETLVISLNSAFVLPQAPVKFATEQANSAGSISVTLA